MLHLPLLLVVVAVLVGVVVVLVGPGSRPDPGFAIAADGSTGAPGALDGASASPVTDPRATAGTAAPAADGVAAAAGASAEGASEARAAPGSPAAAGTVTVHVVGAVLEPGLVELPAAARVADAVAAAGGPAADADLARVNLARPLLDGEQVLVPLPGETLTATGATGSISGAPPQPGGTGSVAAAGPVDLNTAGIAELDSLPGVGPVIAGRIVAWRTDVGPFTSVADLTAVSGIGDALVAGLDGLATV